MKMKRKKAKIHTNLTSLRKMETAKVRERGDRECVAMVNDAS